MNKVIVAGSINMDIITRVAALPLPGETICGRSVEYLPGGKGLNQAVACAKMGIETILASCFGRDTFAETLRRFLLSHHIDISYIKESPKESGTAFITVADNGQNTIVVNPGSNADLSTEDIKVIPVSSGDIIISQFEIPLPTITALFRRGKENGARTVLNPSPIQNIPRHLLELSDIVIVNETELSFICNNPLNSETSTEEIIATAQNIRTNPSQIIIVTLGRKGALIIGDELHKITGCAVNAVDTVGAGDCFTGVLASQLLTNKPLKHCAELANRAAGLCATRKGAAPAMPDYEELFPD